MLNKNKHDVRNWRTWALLAGLIGFALLLALIEPKNLPRYAQHKTTATMFYVGEHGDESNGYISNTSSAWDEDWQSHFGGVDTPGNRNGWLPAEFTPKQNPFYIALPYNDLDNSGKRKTSAKKIYWYDLAVLDEMSMVKDRWIKICRDAVCAYGQWEDAGPFGEDDVNYVFGTASPRNKTGVKAGIDVSPALDDYLKINGQAEVIWQFIDEKDVPAGPWRDIITTNRIN